jgi:hypothetical protein
MNNMRYIKGKYTGGRERGLELQNDGKIWHQDANTGRFAVDSSWKLEMDFDDVVDGIYFAKAKTQFNQTKIFFMVPETHFLFNEPMIVSKMYYHYFMMSESQRERIDRFATRAVIDIIKTKLGIKI